MGGNVPKTAGSSRHFLAAPARRGGCSSGPPPAGVLEESEKISQADQSAAPTEEHHGGNGTRLAQEDTTDTFAVAVSRRPSRGTGTPGDARAPFGKRPLLLSSPSRGFAAPGAADGALLH